MSAQSERIAIELGEMPESGVVLLNDLHEFIGRFCVFPDQHAHKAATLWAAHTHMVKHFYTTPRLALLSPDPGSGKTRVLEVLDLLVPESMFSLNASPAAIFRCLDEQQITLLFDEVDAVWSGRGRDDNHEDLRSLLNAGYKRGAKIPRCVGPKHEVKHFKVYCAVALAGIGELPDTIMSRSIVIKMRRRAPDEDIEQFRIRTEEPLGHQLRQRLANWAGCIGADAVKEWPEMPEGVVDRNAELWEPLLVVADAAGGDWPEDARSACTSLIKVAEDRRVSLGIRLLGDLRTIFKNSRALSTAQILDSLTSEHTGLDDDAPWADLRGNPINARKLASLLKRYGVKSKKVKIDGVSLQGYRREDLWDNWQRWLPPPSVEKAEPTEPKEPDRMVEPFRGDSEVPDRVPEVPASAEKVPDKENGELGLQTAETLGSVPEVPEVPDIRGANGELTI